MARIALSITLIAAPAWAQIPAQTQAPATSIAARTGGLEKRDGFIPVYLDVRQGKILLELRRDSQTLEDVFRDLTKGDERSDRKFGRYAEGGDGDETVALGVESQAVALPHPGVLG